RQAGPQPRVPDTDSPRAAAPNENVAAGVDAEAPCPRTLEDRGGPFHGPTLYEARWIQPAGGADVEKAAGRDAVRLAACENLADVGVGGVGLERSAVQLRDLAVVAVRAEGRVDASQPRECLSEGARLDVVQHLDRGVRSADRDAGGPVRTWHVRCRSRLCWRSLGRAVRRMRPVAHERDHRGNGHDQGDDGPAHSEGEPLAEDVARGQTCSKQAL